LPNSEHLAGGRLCEEAGGRPPIPVKIGGHLLRFQFFQRPKDILAATEPAQELDLAVSTFEAHQFLFLACEPVLHLPAGRAECMVGHSLCVGVPVAFLVWSVYSGGLLDGFGDRAASVAGDSHPNSDLGVAPRRSRALLRLLLDDLGQMAVIDRRRRHGRRLRTCLTVRRVRSSGGPSAFAFSGDRLLKIGVRDLEAVLGGQVDADSLEPLVSANGERAPLLGAQLEGGENAFPSVAVIDVDLLTPVREGRRPEEDRAGLTISKTN
jgi:hypothetical protein